MSLISDSLKDAKEVVTLNKFWLAGMVVWGFIIAYILSVSSFGLDCTALSNVAIVGFAIGVAVSFVDYMIELFQDLSYFCSDDELDNDEVGKAKQRSIYDHHLRVPSWWRGTFNVPRKFSGCYWLYLPNDVFCRARRAEPFLIYLLEALIRLAGNIALFMLVVLASLYSSMKAATQGGQPCLAYFNSNIVLIDINILFWVTLALTAVRALVAFSYPDREEDISKKPKARPKKHRHHHRHHHHHHHHAGPPRPKRLRESSTTTTDSSTDSSDDSDDDETSDSTNETTEQTTNTTEQTSINMDGNEKPLDRPKKAKKASKPTDKPADEKPAEKPKDKPTPEVKTVEQQAHS